MSTGTLRNHRLPIRTAMIKKTKKHEWGERRGNTDTLGRNVDKAVTNRKQQEKYLRKLNSELPYEPANPFLGISPMSPKAMR